MFNISVFAVMALIIVCLFVLCVYFRKENSRRRGLIVSLNREIDKQSMIIRDLNDAIARKDERLMLMNEDLKSERRLKQIALARLNTAWQSGYISNPDDLNTIFEDESDAI